MSMDSHFCRTCGEFHCKDHLPIASSALDESARPRTKSYFVIWHDYEDGVSHGKVIPVPAGRDPEGMATSFLIDYVGMNQFLLDSVQEIKEGEVREEF